MKKHNFQAWLNQPLGDDPEVVLAGKLEYLRLYLTDAMRELRSKAGLTQAQLAEKLGVQQAAVSKLESALKDHELESVVNYLHALDADLLVAVKQGKDLYQASNNEEVLLVDVPISVAQLASTAGMSAREYAHTAIDSYIANNKQASSSVVNSIIPFLESDDLVAVKVRKVLKDKPLSEIASQLEKCLKIAEEDRIFAVKDLLLSSMIGVESYRNVSNDNDEIALLDLAEELVEKLDIFLKI
ncbi:MAG: helix-turn-helix transcriptional regulator [Calothrix sp. FI2-JRJ7]|jgi:DNA-binding XRE family transcriptional regulator|nr:helix-turn-helix transcriptional regulator [Calothrix sp. FI2-JRJ7]